MTRPWWHSRDPDLVRDRTTKSLGRRDWSWFATYDDSTESPADVGTADPPWAPHPFTAKDRHDRTLGIPSRQVSMWPGNRPAPDEQARSGRNRRPSPDQDAIVRRRRASRIMNDLRRVPEPTRPPDVAVTDLAAALTELGPLVHQRPRAEQREAVTAVAARHGMDAGVLLPAARGVGGMIGKTAHRPPPGGPGERGLNQLLGADMPLAAQMHLARARLAHAAARSDPDLPRLWILLNGLHHGVPAGALVNQPARSHGPLARVVPLHHDLVGWHGVGAAVDQLEATVRAAAEARRWLAKAADTAENRLLGLGAIQLTHPTPAYELIRAGPDAVPMAELRALAAGLPTPKHVVDLSDEALKAVCDRNNWLLGTTEERTDRELVERTLPAAITDDVRARLADGDTSALTAAIIKAAPSDAELDRASWRRNPPSFDAGQRRQLLDLASREVLHQFAGLDLDPRPSRAAAIAGRFPERVSQRGLQAQHLNLLASPAPAVPQFDVAPRADVVVAGLITLLAGAYRALLFALEPGGHLEGDLRSARAAIEIDEARRSLCARPRA